MNSSFLKMMKLILMLIIATVLTVDIVMAEFVTKSDRKNPDCEELYRVNESNNSLEIQLLDDLPYSITIPLAAPFGAEVIVTSEDVQDFLSITVREAGFFRDNRIIALDLVPMETDANVDKQVFNQLVKVEFTPVIEKTFLEDTDKKFVSDPLDTVLTTFVKNPVQSLRWRKNKHSHLSPLPRMQNRSSTVQYKIVTMTKGVVRVADEIDFSGVNPDHIQVLNLGNAVPIVISGGDDGSWDLGDYLEFPVKPYLNADGTENKYTLENVYWITTDENGGLRMNQRPGNIPGGLDVVACQELTRAEENTIAAYSDYFWDTLRVQESKDFPVEISNIVHDTGSCYLRLRVLGMTSIVDVEPDHHMTVALNGTHLHDAWWDSVTEYTLEMEISSTLLMNGVNTVTLGLPGDTAAGELDGAFIDWVEIEYPRQLVPRQNALEISRVQPVSSGIRQFQVTGFSDPRIRVWRLDTSSVITPVTVVPSATDFAVLFSDDNTENARYLVFSEDAELSELHLNEDVPSNLSSPSNQADLLMITHDLFYDALNPLVNHRQNQGYTVKKVSVQNIYDEFSYGIFSPEAIRDFLKYTWDNWQEPHPSAVLLVGDANWDYKGYIPGSNFENFVPGYGKDWGGDVASSPYDRGPTDVSDLLYGEPMVDEQMVCVSGEDNLPDMLLGRLAVNSVTDLEESIQRILEYETISTDKNWWKRCYFVNGGFNTIEHDTFRLQADTLVDTFVKGGARPWIPVKTYKTTEGHDPGIYTDEILSHLNRGTGIVNYFGHAGTWSWEAMLDFDDLDQLSNQSKTPFICSMTCNTSRFANPVVQCFGERLMATGSSENGAVAVWGGCNFGGFWSDYYLAYFFYKSLLKEQAQTFGHAILSSKLENLVRYPSYSIIIEPYVLLGDPLLRPNRPSRPHVWVQGWLDTHLTSTGGGQAVLGAFIQDADGLDDITDVDLMWAGETTGLKLYDDGEHGDFGAGDGVFGIILDVPPGSIGAMSINLGVRARDSRGNLSGVVNGVMSW